MLFCSEGYEMTLMMTWLQLHTVLYDQKLWQTGTQNTFGGENIGKLSLNTEGNQ